MVICYIVPVYYGDMLIFGSTPIVVVELLRLISSGIIISGGAAGGENLSEVFQHQQFLHRAPWQTESHQRTNPNANSGKNSQGMA